MKSDQVKLNKNVRNMFESFIVKPHANFHYTTVNFVQDFGQIELVCGIRPFEPPCRYFDNSEISKQ